MIARRAAARHRTAPPTSTAAARAFEPATAPTWARRAAVALLLVAFALRVHLLSEADIWWDEGLAVWAVRQGLAAAVRWTAGDVHPPLFFAALWGWLQLAGDSAFALRLVVALTGLVVTALAWPLGRRLGGPWGGALAVAAVGTSRFLVWWSMELRMYTLAAAAVMVATLGAVRWLDSRRRRDLALYALGAAAALWTVYLAGAALVALNVWVGWAVVGRGTIARRSGMVGHGPKALTPRPPPPSLGEGEVASPGERAAPWRHAAQWALAQIVVLGAFAPWAVYASARMSSWKVVEAGPSLWFTAKLWLTLLATGVSTDIDAAAPWVAAFTAAVLLALAFGTPDVIRRPLSPSPQRNLPLPQTWGRGSGGEGLRRSASLLLALLVIPPLCTWAITQPRSIFYSPRLEARYFVPFAAPVLAVAAAALVRAAARLSTSPRRRNALLAALAIPLLLAPSLWHLPAYYAPRRATDTLPTMALAIWSEAEPGDVVMLVSGNRYPLWLYHYDRQWVQPLGTPRYEFPADAPPKWTDRPPVVLFPDRGSDPLAAHADWQSKLDGIVDNHERVWLVEYGRDLQDHHDEVEFDLAGRLKRVLSEGYGADALHLFTKDGRRPVVTGLSSRWPGTVGLTMSGPAQASPSMPLDHPLVGRPARRALVGDTVNLTWFGFPPSPGRSSPTAITKQNYLVVATFGTDSGPGAGAPSAAQRTRLSLTIDRRAVGGEQTVHAEAKRSGASLSINRVLTVLGPKPLGPAMQILWPPELYSGVDVPRATSSAGHLRSALLEAVDVSPRRVSPGGSVVVDLQWGGTPPSSTVAFVHLIGPPRPNGSTVWAGEDGPPSSGPWRSRTFDRHVLDVPVDAPSGVYSVEMGLYEAATGHRLDVAGPADVADPPNRRFLLGTVDVR